MKAKQKKEPVPKERKQTIRQEIIEKLKAESLSVSELSQLVGRSEKEITEQLTQIQQSKKLKIAPAECLNCGFVFEGRTRTKKPGKCPKCRQSRLSDPLFSMD